MFLAGERFDNANTGESFLHGHNHLSHVFEFAGDGLAGAATINAQRNEAGGKEDERHQCETPVHVEQDEDAANDADGLFK